MELKKVTESISRERIEAAIKRAGSAKKLAALGGTSESSIYQYKKDSIRVSAVTRGKIEKAVITAEVLPVLYHVKDEPVIATDHATTVTEVAMNQIRQEYGKPSLLEEMLRMALEIAKKDRKLQMYEELEKWR